MTARDRQSVEQQWLERQRHWEALQQVERESQRRGYSSPEEMMEAVRQAHRRAEMQQALEDAQEQAARQQEAMQRAWHGLPGGPSCTDAPGTTTPARRARATQQMRHLLETSMILGVDWARSRAPDLQASSQEPRQWNLTTIKRCVVTREEFQYYGSIEAVLQQKGFPTGAPEDGSILLSWFDQQEGVAYYEVARVQDQSELVTYMLEHFHGVPQEEGIERMVEFE